MKRPASKMTTWRKAVAASDLPPNTKLVAATLANWMSGNGDQAHPSVATLAESTSLGQRAVQRALSSLREAQWIVAVAHSQGGHGKATVYRAEFPGRVSLVTQKGVAGDAPRGPMKGTKAGTDVPASESLTSVSPSVPSPEPPAQDSTHWGDLFVTLARVCGIDVHEMTSGQRGRVGAGLKQIKRARELAGKELRVGDLEARAGRYQLKYRGGALTPTALAGHWAELGPGSVSTPLGEPIPGDVMGGTR